MKNRLYFFGIIFQLLFTSCQSDNPSAYSAIQVGPTVCLLENAVTDYRLQQSIQVLKDPFPGYTIQAIGQPSFTLENLASAANGNLVMVILLPYKLVTTYFRGKSERTTSSPSFFTHLKQVDTYYDGLLKAIAGNAIFIGFLMMMSLYKLILYFFERDRSLLFYAAYLMLIVLYTTYASEEVADWFAFFQYQTAYLQLSNVLLYLATMCYLAFISSFMNFRLLLPKWHTSFKRLIYLGLLWVVCDLVVFQYTDFTYGLVNWIVLPYIMLGILACCLLLYPLIKAGNTKGYFMCSGIGVLCVGALLTLISRVWLLPFSFIYLKSGIILEAIIFSVWLAYHQKKQMQDRQQADLQHQESPHIQEKQAPETYRLKELKEMKSHFFTNIIHEFRSPLTVIMGITENIKNNKQKKILIQRNSLALLRLTNQLLDMSKLESGQLSLHKVHQNIIMYLQYLTESFSSSAALKNIRLLFHSSEERVMMDYDEEKIRQLMYNLLSNALKFTQAFGEITLQASRTEQNGRSFLKVKVTDTGTGIPAEKIGLIFNKFYQVKQEESSTQAGTGIGLALTKELVELMNGWITVQSQEGEGTEFTLYLPIEAQPEVTSQVLPIVQNDLRKVRQDLHFTPLAGTLPEAAPPTAALPLCNLPDLLIIEDNPDIITYLITILTDHYKIHTARNGTLGIEKALVVIPDIIISDVIMSEKNGYEVCKTLKHDERTSHIPIVLLTAKRMQADKVDGLKYGADALLTKPFHKEELMIQLENLLESRHQMLLHYVNTDDFPPTAAPSADDIFLQKLNEHIQNSLKDSEFGVSQLALAAGMSQMQLYRKLKVLTGKTPSQFIRSYRLRKGIELLKGGALNISQIAYETGFTDPSYFSRVFHKEYGASPRYFMK